MESHNFESIDLVTRHLLEYCIQSDWAGYDPYDALNSRLFRSLPFLDFKLPRLVLTQTLKRSPLNIRPFLLVPKTHNPKGIALFLSALVKLQAIGFAPLEQHIARLGKLLLDLRSNGQTFSTWGYSFDWQTRTELVPKGSPNIICTTFAANALLDAYEATGDELYAAPALSAAEFILQTLFSEKGNHAWFNYTPLESTQIHNANLLGAALLCRVASVLGEKKFFEPALRATRFSTERQNSDGSWFYGEREVPSQKWIDNFHTGFNLCALRNIEQFSDTTEFSFSISRGLSYFLENFFESDGAPKYFQNKLYPVDIHSAAQALVTMAALRSFDSRCNSVANSVLDWTIRNLWNGKDYFFYQKHRYFTNRIPYIRWSQAWMLLALASAKAGEAHRPSPQIPERLHLSGRVEA